jgi:spermidine synthase
MQEPTTPSSPRFLPLLILLFVGSGCAALIYEIVWFQMLQLVIGSTAVSLGVLLATFMGGMCAGSLVWPWFVSPRWHPLRVYALLELGIGLAGLIVLLLMPIAGDLYVAIAGRGFTGVALRGVLAGILLLPPTFMMGATLPVIARWMESTPRGVAWLGFFYGGNTAGAVAGCIVAGFYLLRVYDMRFTTLVAFGVNLAVAVIAWILAGYAPQPAISTPHAEDGRGAPAAITVYVSIALSGLCALGAEVIWTRNLSLLMGGTVYTFSLILAVFLAGLGIGSAAGSILARDSAHPRLLLGGCQFLQTVAILWAAFDVAALLPYWPIDETLTASPIANLHMDIMRTASAVLPAAVLWGASFPLALAAVCGPGRDAGRIVGKTYAANTVGAIFGALLTALLFIPSLGTAHTQQLLIAVTAVSALVVALPAMRKTASAAIAIVLAVVFVNWLARQTPQIPWQLVAFGRQMPTNSFTAAGARFVGEGLNSTVAVTETRQGVLSFHVAGKTEASTLPKDMRLQRMLGHIPGLLHPNPKSVLIVGMGAGVTAGSFIPYPSIERIVVCEIEPLIPQRVAPEFREQNYDLVNDPRVEIVYDDARHYIRTTKEKFDIITSDPIHPWVKGAATLYTAEYFQMVKDRLNPGGVVTQWVPFYESSAAVVKSELATFFEVFPEGTIWGNDEHGLGYDTVMLGQNGPMRINIDEIDGKLQDEAYSRVRDSLAENNLASAAELMMTYAGRRRDLDQFLANAFINRDRDLRLQYIAGLELNSGEGRAIYIPMLNLRQFPNDMLIGSEETLNDLAARMELPR